MEIRYIAYMASFSDLRPHHDKAIRVILSCKSYDQLSVAEKYTTLFHKLHEENLAAGYNPERVKYQTALNESKRLITDALIYQRKRIRLQARMEK